MVKNSPKSLKTCYPLKPPIMPNFVEIGQTTLEKSVTKICYTLQCFGSPWDPLGQGSPVWVVGYTNPFYLHAKFRPVPTTPLRDICCQTSSILLSVWPTKTYSKRCLHITCSDKKKNRKYQKYQKQLKNLGVSPAYVVTLPRSVYESSFWTSNKVYETSKI